MKDEKQLNNEELKDVTGGNIHPGPHLGEEFTVGDWCRDMGPGFDVVARDIIYRVTAVNGRELTVKKYTYTCSSNDVRVESPITQNASFFVKSEPPYWQDKIGGL